MYWFTHTTVTDYLKVNPALGCQLAHFYGTRYQYIVHPPTKSSHKPVNHVTKLQKGTLC